ncbi:Aspartyl/glutamyl-tRNA(Asn/Gln) amidotransferase subunit B [Candidatus Vidania fulgoroideae]|uniref:Aspartyl/glutamyl-tRNA(Asn/Gln) amidotransferase subunit B n=1 Tax=Candidatus Vidania fulgoroideorum TaxID=881286 RepID=A0A346E0F9_9PROT|nr:Aspartyl/glutamyl-tRNA(Asn/Gln) amidotransferase subunit B [Candidatus Vidania fulgoroideae]
MKKYNFIIGIEIHTGIYSKRKLFSKSKINNFNKFDLAIPGVMPILNVTIINKTIDFLQNFEGKFCKKIIFLRKKYSYPDIPKGYQLTQKYIKKNCIIKYYKNNILKFALIKNFHIEEDTAGIKYINNKILINYKRNGRPILESVSFPCFSFENIIFFLKTFKEYCVYEKYSTARMEMGEFKFDINISIINKNVISKKIEIKNLNSYTSLEKSIKYEMYRLIKNICINKETRSYSQIKEKTFFLRKKKKYFFFREYNLKKYKIEFKKKINKINIIFNNSKSFLNLIKNLKNDKYFFKKKLKTICKKIKKKKKIKIDNKLIKKIIHKIKNTNERSINYIIGKYKRIKKIENFNFFKKKVKKIMKERDLNP